MIEADGDHYIRDGNWEQLFDIAKPGSQFGVHGYDPEEMKMYAEFFMHRDRISRAALPLLRSRTFMFILSLRKYWGCPYR